MEDQVSSFQRRMWMAQRVGWLVLSGILLVAAIGGLGGSGPMNRRTLRSADGTLELRYERVQRVETERELEWSIKAATDRGELELDSAFGAALAIERIDPDPERMESDSSGIRRIFASRPGKPVEVRMLVKPRRTGRYDLRARTRGSDWVVVPMTVLP